MDFNKLKKLEEEGRKLEPSPDERKKIRDQVIEYTEGFINDLPDLDKMPTYQLSKDKGSGILDHPVGKPYDLEKLISIVKSNVDSEGLNPASGGHLGYIPGGGIYTSSLGDYWADITNRYAGVFFANPGAVRMENHLIDWMKSMIGFPKDALGNLASGGSIANLIAIVTAREAKNLRPRDYENAVVYLSPQTHHCVDKALNIAGLQHAKWRKVPLDEQYRMKPDMLQILIEEDRANGLNPWMVIASAGTTDTGAIDPLDELADIAEKENLWLHVDGAYGAFFVLLEEFKNKLDALSRADSVVMDPHKGLFMPYGTGVVLVKNGEAIKQAFSYSANYMQDTVQHLDETSPAEVSPELTKHFRGLRMWLPLMLHGVGPFKACLKEKILLARYFYEQLDKEKSWELGPYPQMSVVTFRYIPEEGDINEFNQELIRKIHEDGRVFLSSTRVNGKFIIRLAVLSFRTHKETIDFALKMLNEKVHEIKKAPSTSRL
ncbi:MAG: pyridoxal phosphate-dependent decarboxylase family protein [Candidatus Cyclobacteriaceae bacterium M2_1C_046]